MVAAGRRESVFFKAVASATSAVLQSVTTQPRVYEQLRLDVISLKENIKLGRWGRGMGGKSYKRELDIIRIHCRNFQMINRK